MCNDHEPRVLTRRRVLSAAATVVAAGSLGLTLASPAAAQEVSGAPLADGSGDPADRPSQRPAPAGRTTSTLGAGTQSTVAAGYVSQNGWSVPTTNNAGAIGVATYPVAGTSTRLSVRGGEVATVLVHVAERFAQTVQALNANCGGYSWRENVNSPGTWSNHASGTAIDLNWNLHPNGSRGTFQAWQVEAIRAILSECRGLVRWGGDYTSTADEMHFEINVSPGDARLTQLADDLRAGSPRRLAVVLGAGALAVKDGSLFSGWSGPAGRFTSLSSDGRRTIGLTTDGLAMVCDGPAGGSWSTLAGGIVDVAVGGGRIAVVDRAGALHVKEGPIDAGWTTLRPSRVTRVVLDGSRIGVLHNGGAEVKDGSLGSSWERVAERATDIAVESRRVAVVSDGVARVQDGPLRGSSFVGIAQADLVRLSGNRIGIVGSGVAHAKEGVYGQWGILAAGVSELALSGDRTAVVVDGVLHVKQGGLDAGWTTQTDDCRAVSLSG